MKKFKVFFVYLLACLMAHPAYAESVVTKIGTPIKDMGSIKVGDKLLLYCNGPVDPSDAEYGTRNAFLREDAGYDVNLSRDLRENEFSSGDYLWEVLSCEQKGNELKISFKSPRGNYLPAFIDDIETYGKWARWMGRTVSTVDSIGVYTMSATEITGGDTLFYFKDENGVYFNGQNLPKGTTTGTTKFVGWNGTGGNSIYMVYKPTVKEEKSYKFTFYLQDQYENQKPENGEYLVEAKEGDTLQVPVWEHHTFKNAFFDETGKEFQFPYVVDGKNLNPDETPFIILTYQSAPYFFLDCIDKANGARLYKQEGYFSPGQKIAMPETPQLGMGYELVGPEEYLCLDSITMGNEDIEILLEYQYGNQGVPFATTVVENNQFAANTAWYHINIRGNKTLSYNASNKGVKCAPTQHYDDSHLWAFEGDLTHGFKIYNKKAGAGKIMWAANGNDGTALKMTDKGSTTGSANTFDLYTNGNGFVWKLHDSDNAYVNDYAASGELKFWASDQGKTDEGSKVVFTLYSDEIAKAIKYAEYIPYINAENCVGGWTSQQLADLKAAVAGNDLTACQKAVEALQKMETIAFDIKKCYALVSAYNGYITHQPGAAYALTLQNENHELEWKSLDETDRTFYFGFRGNEGSTYQIVSIPTNLPIASFRLGSHAKCVAWGPQPDANGYADGVTPARFSLVKSGATPAAFHLIHQYDESNTVALAALSFIKGTPRMQASDAMGTMGYVSAYNNMTPDYNNYWRLKVIGEWDSIEETVAADAEHQTLYDLSGRRVEKVQKGIYIMNGKKVFVK